MKNVTTFSAEMFATPVLRSVAESSTTETGIPRVLEVNVKRIFVALVALLLIVCCSSCKTEGEGVLPRELQGAWVTDDTQYAERLIKFWPSEYVILTGVESQASVRSVYKVDRQPYGSGFTLTIFSKSRAGDSDQIGLTFTPANGGELRFRNQKPVWKRVPEK